MIFFGGVHCRISSDLNSDGKYLYRNQNLTAGRIKLIRAVILSTFHNFKSKIQIKYKIFLKLEICHLVKVTHNNSHHNLHHFFWTRFVWVASFVWAIAQLTIEITKIFIINVNEASSHIEWSAACSRATHWRLEKNNKNYCQTMISMSFIEISNSQ